MFVCQICSDVVPAGVSCHKRVTQKRIKNYPFRPNAKQEWRLDKKGNWKWTWIDDPGGVGYEAVTELYCCPACAARIDKNVQIQTE